MPVIGSSTIIPLPATGGPVGRTGNVGPAGAAGGYGFSGATGPTGATGIYVSSSTTVGKNLILILSDGSEIEIEGLSGVTGDVSATSPPDGITVAGIVDAVSVFKEVIGNTFWFRGISAEGSLSVYETDATVGISGDSSPQGATLDGEPLHRKVLAYLTKTDTIGMVIGNTFGWTAGITYDTENSPNRSLVIGNDYDPEERIITLGPICRNCDECLAGECVVGITGGPWSAGQPMAGNGIGIQLETRYGTVFDVQTPIGIAGITGDFKKNQNELINFTVILRGNDIWEWPTNVTLPVGDSFTSCGTDIINFASIDQGQSWLATIAARGYEVDSCQTIIPIGSCCYRDEYYLQKCLDYVTREECDNYDSSLWSSFFTCDQSCGPEGDEGVCCSEGGNWEGGQQGVCIDVGIVSADECAYYGGTYWTHYYYTENPETGEMIPILEGGQPITCGPDGTWPDGVSMNETLCVDPCVQPWACCRNGTCIGDSLGSAPWQNPSADGDFNLPGGLPPISKYVCKYVYGGSPVSGSCGQYGVDCCDEIVYTGACCQTDGYCNDQDQTHEDCVTNGGVFMGPGTVCSAVNCCVNDNDEGYAGDRSSSTYSPPSTSGSSTINSNSSYTSRTTTTTNDRTRVRLPSGECVLMMCSRGNCPYEECD